jgi:hypothetical protein
LYRLFQDKRGLLDAATDHGFALYLSAKREMCAAEDPVQFLRDGWARHVQFGLAHPALYKLMYADPEPVSAERCVPRGYPGLTAHMQTVAAAGRLRLPVELAADLFHAAACGVVLTLLRVPEREREMELSQVACEAALASILTDLPVASNANAAGAANMLRAQLLGEEAQKLRAKGLFTPSERALLLEWLARVSAPLP